MVGEVPERSGRPGVRVAPVPTRALGSVAWLVSSVAALVTRGERPRVLTTLARHRRLFRWWLPFAGVLLLRSELPRVDVELVVLRTACNCRSRYEWAQHVTLAARAGLAPEAVRAIPRWAGHDGWTARQRLLLAATDELHERRMVTDAPSVGWQSFSRRCLPATWPGSWSASSPDSCCSTWRSHSSPDQT